MAVPFYVLGLAEEGKDEIFHSTDDALRQGRLDPISVSKAKGSQAFYLMLSWAVQSRSQRLQHPMPFECANKIREHQRTCPDGCDHTKQCPSNNNMWLPLEQQLNNPYAGHLSDELAAHFLEFYTADIEELRATLIDTLRTHGDVILKRWKKMSKDKRGLLLTRTSPILGDWPMKTGRCDKPDCHEEHPFVWPHVQGLNNRDLAEDW